VSALDVPVRTSHGPDAGSFSGRPLGWWGLMAMIATEAMMFALLFFVNLELRVKADEWPLGGLAGPELKISGLRTLLLLASSIPIHFAERAAERGDFRGVARGLATAWLMGALFLAGHAAEWHTLWKEVTPSTDAYGSVFYTITGLHALHLLVGLIVVGYLWFGSVNGRYATANRAPIHNGALYWHFVDAVWVFVYTLLYLSVRS
jgi:heme/copper-type cytochrome/quinol oxidase subunit 3